jgi:hypothetical protein
MKTIDVKRAITLFFFMPRDKKIRANDTRAAMRFHLFEVHVNLKFEVKCRGRLEKCLKLSVKWWFGRKGWKVNWVNLFCKFEVTSKVLG